MSRPIAHDDALAATSSVLLTPIPRVVQEPDVSKVVVALTDPARRGLAFVAGTAYAAKVTPWRDAVESMLGDTEGLANAWVLSPSATDRFNYLVPPALRVSEGFVRTFLPGVDIGNALDSERHRYLTRGSLKREPSRALRRLFGQRAREQMIAARLPDVLRDLDRILRREIDSELLDELTAAPREPAAAVRAEPAPVSRSTHGGVHSWARTSRSLSRRRSARGCTTWTPRRARN